MLAVAIAFAFAAPLCLLAVLALNMPGPAPRRRALRTAGFGLGVAMLLAAVTRGESSFTLLVAAGGVLLVTPIYIAAFARLHRASTTGESLVDEREGLELAVVLGMATWSAPLGLAAGAADVALAKSYIERLSDHMDAERVRTGTYPAHEDLEAQCAAVGWRPPALLDGLHYYAWDDHVELGFRDPSVSFGMYCWHGRERGWDRWSD
jgi:hypothetical protein